MGLRSKQVSSNGIDWRQTLLQAQTLEVPIPPTMREQRQQNQLQQHDKLKCPRCDSTNTKFCYYNNYNKSQPRHFCKACKRHWTKGGTLRNVPVGGGRKNKRLKTSTPTTTATATSASTAITKNNMSNRLNIHMAIQAQHRQNLPLALGDDQKIMSAIFYQDLIRPPSLLLPQNFTSPSNLDSKNSKTDSSIFLPQTQNLLFPFSSAASFERNPSSISTNFQSSNAYSYMGESKTMQDPSITSIMATTSSTFTHQCQVPATSSGMDMSSYWNWDDINTFTTTDLQIPWEDTEIKP